MVHSCRHYAGDEDNWRIRAFLRQLTLDSGLRPPTWHVARWDYWRTHGIENVEWQDLCAVVRLWEDERGRLVAMLNPEGCGEAFLHVRPDARTTGLLGAMIEEAACRLARHGPDGRQLRIWSPASDEQLGDALAEHGYVMAGTPEDLRCASLDATSPEAAPVGGYQIRALEPGDFPARGLLSLRVFHPEPDGSDALTDAQYRVIQRGPLYRRDLDLVAEAPDGCLAGFATVWFDDLTRSGVFEPVGVDPDHRRRGLGRALLAEGMRRLRRYRARCAFVGSYGPEAGGLYESVGLIPYGRLNPWVLEPGR